MSLKDSKLIIMNYGLSAKDVKEHYIKMLFVVIEIVEFSIEGEKLKKILIQLIKYLKDLIMNGENIFYLC